MKSPGIKIKHISSNKTLPGAAQLNTFLNVFSFLLTLFFADRRSRSTTSGVAVRDPCIAPSAWREAAWRCRSSPVRSVSDRWKGRGRYSSCTQIFRRYDDSHKKHTEKSCKAVKTKTKKMQHIFTSPRLLLQCRLCHHTRPCRQEAPACRPLKWDRMPFVCPTPSARRSVPVWMCPAPEDATGGCWLAAWALTGQTRLTCFTSRFSQRAQC